MEGSARCVVWRDWRCRGRRLSGGRVRGLLRECWLSDVMGFEDVREEGVSDLKSAQEEEKPERGQAPGVEAAENSRWRWGGRSLGSGGAYFRLRLLRLPSRGGRRGLCRARRLKDDPLRYD